MAPSLSRAASVLALLAVSAQGPVALAAEAGAPQKSLRNTSKGNTCDKLCVIDEVAASCRDHIQRSSLVDFLGDPQSCNEAQALVADRCEVCSRCPAHEAYCDVLELPSTTPPTTTIPPGGACEATCELGGQGAKCKDRILWSSINTFPNKPDACSAAHKMVLSQCEVCSKCELPKVGCEDADSRAVEAAKRAAEEAAATAAEFDCAQDYKTWKEDWSKAKQHWCCEKEGRGCNELTDIEIVRQKFDLGSFHPRIAAVGQDSAGAQWRSAALGSLLIIGGAVGLIIAVGVFGQARRQARQESAGPQALLSSEACE